MFIRISFVLICLFYFTFAVRINFTSCQEPEWTCLSASTEIIYTCSAVRSNDFIIHLKDYYNENTISVTIQNCKDVRIVLDCPVLQKPSRLQHFKIKDCDRVEFITLSSSSVIQTPPEFTIENVREIVSLPKNIFKAPSSYTEMKCMGTTALKKIRVINSKINSINTKAISNVTQATSVEFENVTIINIETLAIDLQMYQENTLFSLTNSKIENMDFKSITIRSSLVKILNNNLGNILANVMNITAKTLLIQENIFTEINAYGITTRAIKTDITNNNIKILRTNALSSIKCAKRRANGSEMKFTKNVIEKAESFSLHFDYNSCKIINAQITHHENKIGCKCRDISYLNANNDLNNIILSLSNNNTCLITACHLPIEIVKLLLENDMCHLNLDPQVLCLLYNDKHSNNEVTTYEDVTEEAPTLYLIRQANSLQEAGAAMTALDKDDLLRDSNLNTTNRTSIKIVFDPSRDFVETLRSTRRTTKPLTENKLPPREEYLNRCINGQCKNIVTYDRQKALDFYKYVYAQLRPSKLGDTKKNKT